LIRNESLSISPFSSPPEIVSLPGREGMNEEASAGEEDIQSLSLLSVNERRIRRAPEILGFSARLDPWKDHRLMIPKECPLARTPNLLITTQPPDEGRGRREGGF